ncbi:hypothetical protein [Synechococcus sp. RedBA-s]|uniref:hypothetical protein n=1 Tax=Synechococcus sp. RedBA-s TaxID=2823741 RepID=UPI0020CD19F5|nr:hypothetical protein [Synechococcus sp. RedBA-s]MCP9801711.1 hypothetical protein [Synechococcus sp. RedBA-s]
MGGDQRPISSSRAFWELKAEQVMDRVFCADLPGLAFRPGEWPTHEGYSRDLQQPEPSLGLEPGSSPAPIDVVVHEPPPHLRPASRTGTRSTARPRNAVASASTATRNQSQRSLLVLMALLSVLGAGSTVLVWRGWTQASIALQQERTLQLLERLRSVGPLGGAEPGATAAATAQPPGQAGDGSANGLPPPPEEAWVQELEPLESSSRPSAALPLRVPVSGTITRGAKDRSGEGLPGAGGGGAGARSERLSHFPDGRQLHQRIRGRSDRIHWLASALRQRQLRGDRAQRPTAAGEHQRRLLRLLSLDLQS